VAAQLLDYRKRWAELEASQNPFAVVVMAHLEALRTRHDAAGRKVAKLSLVRQLHRRGFGEPEIRQLFWFIDWLLTLPEELEQKFWTEVRALDEEKKMRYVTSIERIGHKRGLKEGFKAAVRQALEVRFGEAGLALISEVEALDDESLIRRINEALIRGSSLEQIRRIWQG